MSLWIIVGSAVCRLTFVIIEKFILHILRLNFTQLMYLYDFMGYSLSYYKFIKQIFSQFELIRII